MEESIQEREHHGVAVLADSILAGQDGGWEFLDPSGLVLGTIDVDRVATSTAASHDLGWFCFTPRM